MHKVGNLLLVCTVYEMPHEIEVTGLNIMVYHSGDPTIV